MGMNWTYHGGLWVAAGVLTEEEVLLAELLRYHGTHYDVVTQSQQCYELNCTARAGLLLHGDAAMDARRAGSFHVAFDTSLLLG
jgi:hypothetical protein